MRVTKVASTPSNPAVGLVRGVKAILEAGGATADDVASLAHGTTVATNALLQGEIASLGLIVTAGFRHILEIARQSVPEGYGNSYFWVKPERIVPLRFVREVGGRLNYKGEELRPLDEARRARRGAVLPRAGHPRHRHLADPFLRQCRARAARRRDRRAGISGGARMSLSCAVLPEYREYERAVTTLVDAFVKPHMEPLSRRVHDELGPACSRSRSW